MARLLALGHPVACPGFARLICWLGSGAEVVSAELVAVAGEVEL
jgi:hypothetical protein